MYNVFVDFHHASLLNSFILLFERRLGGNVFRPIGMEWATEGFWKVYDHPETQAQYLGFGSATPDNTPPLNEVIGKTDNLNPVYFCSDIDNGATNKAITLDKFLSMKIDIVIATLPQHIEPFKRLCELHPNKPKFIYQIGNAWDVPDNSVANVMASALIPKVPPGVNFISYHQEFDTNLFRPMSHTISESGELVWPESFIFSFVNVFQNFPDYNLFLEVEKLMPDFHFRSYGGQCRDGAIAPAYELARSMNHARFIWHTKAGGDGYGHIIHNAAAVARPLIVKKEYYAGKLAEPLLIDGETCITIDGLTNEQIVEKIHQYNSSSVYNQMCRNAYANFKQVVNFDEEFERIKVFLSNLK